MRSEIEYCCHLWVGGDQCSLSCLELKSIYADLWAINKFQPYNNFPRDQMSQVSHHAKAISMGCLLMSDILWFYQP